MLAFRNLVGMISKEHVESLDLVIMWRISSVVGKKLGNDRGLNEKSAGGMSAALTAGILEESR